MRELPLSLSCLLPGGLSVEFWKIQSENGDTARYALNLRRSLMEAHDRSNNSQAKTRTAFRARATVIDSIKAVEQVRQMLGLDPWAWVAYK